MSYFLSKSSSAYLVSSPDSTKPNLSALKSLPIHTAISTLELDNQSAQILNAHIHDRVKNKKVQQRDLLTRLQDVKIRLQAARARRGRKDNIDIFMERRNCRSDKEAQLVALRERLQGLVKGQITTQRDRREELGELASRIKLIRAELGVMVCNSCC